MFQRYDPRFSQTAGKLSLLFGYWSVFEAVHWQGLPVGYGNNDNKQVEDRGNGRVDGLPF